jgi:DNA-binding MarR family transcriptional regulator
MDKDVKEYWKLFMPVVTRIMEKEIQKRQVRTNELYGISEIHVKYLLALDSGECTLKELSDGLFFNKANTTRAIRCLEEKGYVYDNRISKTSRKYDLFLTENGKKVTQYLKKDIDSVIETFFKGISDEEIRGFIHTINTMCQNIDRGGEYTKTLQYLRDTLNRT